MENFLVLVCIVLSFVNKGVYAQNDTWSSWLTCEKACGGGIQSRYRDQCPADEKNNCVVIESRKCNEFDCSLTSTSQSTSVRSPSTTPIRGESLLSSSITPSTPNDMQEKTSELTTTLLTTYTPKKSTTVSSTTTTTTTTTTTAPPKQLDNSKSGATHGQLNLMVAGVLLWYIS
uniref:Cell wall integrity and stress response component 2-like n=1 Tax=Crassostrea virginica TaxID=6565 RepID=A0A8B8AW39_CRAVI|nr:cell wall integrity and stress response component 2-like [Crassostrea virginica]